MEKVMKLSDLVRMSKVISSPNPSVKKAKEFSVLDKYDMDEYMKQYNAGEIKSKEFEELRNLRLKQVKSRWGYAQGNVEDIQFLWNNGYETPILDNKLEERKIGYMDEVEMNVYQPITSIRVNYMKGSIINIEFLNRDSKNVKTKGIVSQSIGSLINKPPNSTVHTEIIDLKPGEVITGVSV